MLSSYEKINKYTNKCIIVYYYYKKSTYLPHLIPSGFLSMQAFFFSYYFYSLDDLINKE